MSATYVFAKQAAAPEYDRALAWAALLLMAMGLVMVYSASISTAESSRHTGSNAAYYLMRHTVFLGVALSGALAVFLVPVRYWQKAAPWLFLGGVALLVLVLVPGIGREVNGARRWIDLGALTMQPSELMKLAVPMGIAWYLHDKPLPPTFGQLLVAFGIVGLPTLLTAVQPDLGTAALIAASGLFAIYCSGILWRYILGAAALIGAVTPFLWARLHDYQKLRVLNFLDPERDPLGSGYHIIQSKIAVGSGGVFGKGWLEGTQSQLDFLPERHTDFIFAVAGEEFGLLGALLLLATYMFVLYRSLKLAAGAERTFGRLLGGAIALTFVVYVFVNIGMVCGLLPVVGVPLPLISYGGTSLVTLMAGFGILMSIHTHRKLMSL